MMISEELLILLAAVLVGIPGVVARDVTGDEYNQFPALYHLDDFDTCLMQTDGLYCMGTFHVKPLRDPDPIYELMKEYSLDPYNFNRTQLHRGYCVSSRCPALSERNITLSERFERCASARAQRRGFRLLLTELSYCRTHAQDLALKHVSNYVGTPHRLFLYAIGAILALNVLGTFYDVTTSNLKKNKLLTSWSVVSNWPQLAGPYPDDDPRTYTRLPVEAFRTIMIQFVVLVHAICLQDILYSQNPKYIEEMAHQPLLLVLQNGSALIQMFILLSNFLLADSLLRMSQPPSFSVLPKLILKRIFRIAPVYILVISFAATWWPLVRDGPMWPMLVVKESEVCKRKFWTNMFFLQNFVEPQENCQWQTWFLAVDMQLYVVGCIITLCLARVRRRLVLPLLGFGFIGSVAMNSYRAYHNNWKALLLVNTPDHIRTKFQHAPSFGSFYTSPAGSLPACLVGLFMGHLLHHLCDIGFNPAEHKWLIIVSQMLILVLPLWSSTGHIFRRLFDSQGYMALFIALERPVITLAAATVLFGFYNGTANKNTKQQSSESATDNDKKEPKPPKKRFLQRAFGWRVWFPLGRMSLAVVMLHWCVNCTIVGSKMTPVTTTVLDIVAEWISTAFLTYLLAIPVTLMVEIPFQTLYSVLTS